MQDVNIFEVSGRGRRKFNRSIQFGAALDLVVTSWGPTEVCFLARERGGVARQH